MRVSGWNVVGETHLTEHTYLKGDGQFRDCWRLIFDEEAWTGEEVHEMGVDGSPSPFAGRFVSSFRRQVGWKRLNVETKGNRWQA